MKLVGAAFTYVPNTSFRGPEHLWVEWDPAQNPERTRPALLDVKVPVRIGEPSKHAITRPVRVESVTPVADGIVRLRLVSPDGRAAAALDARLAHRRRVRRTPACRASTRCAAIRPTPSARDRGAARGRGPRRLGLDPRERAGRRPAQDPRPAQSLPARRIAVDGHLRRRRHRHHADQRDGAPRQGARHRLRAALQRPPPRDDGAARRARRRCTASGCMSTRQRRRPAQRPRRRCSPAPSPARRSTPAGRCACSRRSRRCCAAWPEDSLRIEHFVSTAGDAGPGAGACLRGRAQGLRHRRPLRADQTVLAALRAANIDVHSDCEEGLCGSCEVAVLAGDRSSRCRAHARGARRRPPR